MARRSPDEVYAALIAAGWPPEAAVTMTAIAGAESGWDSDALGDLGVNDTWGPSFGLFQIRTLKAATGSGSARDIARLAVGDIEQAKAAYVISSGGTDFSPWSVYSSGAYQAHLAAARAAAARLDPDGGPFTIGPEWLPWNWPSVIGNEVVGGVDQVVGGARHIALEAGAVLLGLALVSLGLWRIGAPTPVGMARGGTRWLLGLGSARAGR